MSKRTLKQNVMLGTKRSSVNAATLLRTVGIHELQGRAGYLPKKTLNPTPASFKRESVEYCSDVALKYLRDIFEGKHADALQEWIVLAGEAKQIIPAEYLPTLLKIGRDGEGLRPYIVQVGGERLLWLAEQHGLRWVKRYATNLSEYLAEAYLLERESDAWYTGQVLFDIQHTYSEDNAPIEFRRHIHLEPSIFDIISIDSFTWSIPLTEGYMLAHYKRYFRTAHSEDAYHFSLSIESKRLQAWQNLVCKQPNRSDVDREIFGRTMDILAYRQAMRKAILESA